MDKRRVFLVFYKYHSHKHHEFYIIKEYYMGVQRETLKETSI